MKCHLFASLLLTLAVNASADVTIKGVNYGIDENGQPTGPREPYTMYLKDNRMRMDAADQTTMLIRPTSGGYETVLLDHGRRQAMVVSQAAIDTAQAAVSAAPHEVRVIGRSAEALLGYEVTEVEFAFEGDASFSGLAGGQELPAEMADMMKVTLDVRGTALVSRDVEGIDEVMSLYRQISAAAEMNALTRGLSDVVALVSDHGFPLKTISTSDVRVEIEASGPVANVLRSMMSAMPRMSATTVSEVTEISSATLGAALFFGDGLPEGYAEAVIPVLPRAER